MNTTKTSMIALLALMAAPGFAAEAARIEGKDIRIEFDGIMQSRVTAVLGGQERVVGDFPRNPFAYRETTSKTFPFKNRLMSPSATA